MVTWGPWTTITGIRQSDGSDPSEWPPGYGHTPTSWQAFDPTRSWTMTQSFAMYQAGQDPHTYESARTCARLHAVEGETGGQGSWDPGECAALTGPTPGTATVAKENMIIGSSGHFHLPGVHLLPSTYTCDVVHGSGLIQWWPLWMQLGFPPYGGAKEVHGHVLVQIPGWFDAAARGLEPEVEILRVDGEASITTVGKTQDRLANPTTVLMHSRGGISAGDFPALTPYSGLGSAVASVSSGGATSTVVTVPDMQIGDAVAWDMSSSWLTATTDPGASEENLVRFEFVPDFIWDIRVRFQVPDVINVCRWRNRDDGLGVTAAARARTGTSLQRGNRHRGYR